jgi:hypothetical protein
MDRISNPFCVEYNLLALPTKGKDIVFRFIIIEYNSLRDFGP